MVPACGCNHKKITLGLMRCIKACAAHLKPSQARLDYDPVIGSQRTKIGKMAAGHLPINRGSTEGSRQVSVWSSWSAVPCNPNQWGWGHAMEVRDMPNLRGQPLHHLAEKSHGEGSRITGLRVPSLGQLWRAALSLRDLNAEHVVEKPDHFVTPPFKNLLILGHVGPHSPSNGHPFTTVYPKPSTKLLGGGG